MGSQYTDLSLVSSLLEGGGRDKLLWEGEMKQTFSFIRYAGVWAVASLALLPGMAVAQGSAHVPLPFEEEGSINGAPYKIRVPANWNGTLLVFAHGFRDKADHDGEVDNRSAQAAPGGTPMEDLLLAQGYGLAGSAFKDNGWAVKEGTQNTMSLTALFAGRVGRPGRTLLWGVSLGSIVALKSIEKFSGVYQGAIPLCTVGAGAPRSWDSALAFLLAYDVAFGMPAAWGTVGDVRDDLDFETEVAPVLFGQVIQSANFGRFEFLRLVNDLPLEDFYSGSTWLFTDMFFATEARAELERRARGPVAQNLDHLYSLTVGEKSYLSGLGINADALLAAMNARTNVAPDPPGRRYAERYAAYTGKIRRPVISLHTRVDGLVPPYHESAYAETVAAAGRSDLLVQAFADAVGHCAFGPFQLLTAIQAMEFWLDTGTPPGPAFFPAALGFLPGFVPPPFPYGQP